METKTTGYNLTISVDNFQFSYDDVGEGSIPLIFLHGYPFDKSMWRLQLEFLEPSYRVIALDMRGFGNSKDEKSPLSIDLFGEDVIAFMDELNIDKAMICGLSMGGYVALHVVDKFPDRFQALMLCDTQCIADTAEAKKKRYQVIDKIAADGVSDFNEGFIKSVFCDESLDNKKELVEELRSVVTSHSQHIITMGLAALAERSETCSALSEINIPTLILCGKEDEVTPLAQSEMMHASIDGSVLHVIENAGHVSNLEQPDDFNNYLLEFLTALGDLNFEQVNGSQRMA